MRWGRLGSENGTEEVKRIHTQRAMIGNGDGMRRIVALQTYMTTALPHRLVAETRQSPDQFRSIHVAGKFHAARTSSLT